MAPLGLAGAAVVERLVPVLPSCDFLVAVGIGMAGGLWPAPAIVLSVTEGTLLGCLAGYGVAAALGRAGATLLLHRSARFLGLSLTWLDRWIEHYRHHQERISFGVQLTPTVRLLSPLMAGLLQANPRRLLLASAAGVDVWSTVFIGLGHAAAVHLPETNASVLAI
ncbi:DedA family protein [Muricoccus pecuniae]|uniref:Membrane protein DedA with SNARE-associated domain n=1 Tax=Muricoccus pecuniae TaxID=693023 RepID=A0A840YGR0_9PROT|nr:VTT domain-containing protein [Roseomonas pecuniae]MBB5695491.1 membrane protein DedA with SNARE-associated domain [Roseomonas pecuniae]